jgi:hypothetical protein
MKNGVFALRDVNFYRLIFENLNETGFHRFPFRAYPP